MLLFLTRSECFGTVVLHRFRFSDSQERGGRSHGVGENGGGDRYVVQIRILHSKELSSTSFVCLIEVGNDVLLPPTESSSPPYRVD